MNSSFKTRLYLQTGFFAVFFLFLFFTVFLLVMLVNPARDITNLEVETGTAQTAPAPSTGDNGPADNKEETTDSTNGGSTDKYEYEFSADLSAYEEYMNPSGDEYLALINTDNRLSETYEPEDLMEVKSTRKDGRATQRMRVYAAKALEALFLEAEAQGMTYVNERTGKSLSVMSAYRDYAYQAQRLREETQRLGSEEEALKVVQPAGASEHQSGLCCDMHNLTGADRSFENETAAKWLAENSYKFGFVLRYPKDKEDITGISFEPWHFRFVGRYHASKMYELGMCLEEYHEYLNEQA